MTAAATAHRPRRARPPGRAFRKLLAAEARLALRAPVGLVFGVALPVLLLIIFGAIPVFRHPVHAGSTVTFFQAYIPVLICLSLALLALISLPIPLVTYRQLGVLRRFAATPAPPSWLLAAQLLINVLLALVTALVLVAGSVLFYGGRLPAQPGGFALALAEAMAAMFAIGLLISARARTPAIASVFGNLALYPMLFFAGLWVPRQNMAPVLQQIGDYTPLGAAVQAMGDAMQGAFPGARALLVLAAWAAAAGVLAVRYFRWD